MRIKESLILDELILNRSKAITGTRDQMEKRAKCLMTLIKCRDKLDEIMRGTDPVLDPTLQSSKHIPPTNIGDITVNVKSPVAPSGLVISEALKREFRKRQ